MHLSKVHLPAIMIPSPINFLAASVVANQAMRWADFFTWGLQCMGFIHLVDIKDLVGSFEFLSILGFSARASGE